jgi:hypothetical protein
VTTESFSRKLTDHDDPTSGCGPSILITALTVSAHALFAQIFNERIYTPTHKVYHERRSDNDNCPPGHSAIGRAALDALK